MSFYFTNSLTRELQQFKSIDKGIAKIYSCGPTVYNYAHIGNFRSYIFVDLLGRALRLGGYQTRHAMNITDVDDKTIHETIKGVSNAGIEDLQQYTRKYIQAFNEDVKAMGIAKQDYNPVATETIAAMILLVEELKKKGYAYEKDGSTYFSIEKYQNYGKLSRIDLTSVKTGLRYNTDEYSKEDVRDFVLWKAEKPDEKIAWHSSLGRGRPGWHLECSAMIHETFHGPIDIHTGGVDLLFPHHENEIAQSECAYGSDFVNYWLHCEHLLVDNKKMSKSAGNFYTLRDLTDKGYHPLALRYLLLSVHYRQKLNFSLEGLEQATQTIKRVWIFYLRLENITKVDSLPANEDFLQKLAEADVDFLKALEDDLNIAKALAVFHETMALTNQLLDNCHEQLPAKNYEKLFEVFNRFDSILNLASSKNDMNPSNEDSDVALKLLAERTAARKEKNFARADEIRQELENMGFEIVDTAERSTLRKHGL